MEEKDIDIDEIDINKDNIRLKVKDADISQLMESIKQNGLLQAIGLFRENSRYTILFGHRRFLAIKKLGWKTIRAIVFDDIDEKDRVILNTVENEHRKDNLVVELGRSCSILRKLDLSVSEIAVRLSIPKSRVEKALNIYTKVPTAFKEKVISMTHQDALKKQGFISGGLATGILSMAQAFGLSIAQKEHLFNFASKQEMTVPQLKMTGYFLGNGYSLERALRELEDWKLMSVDIAVKSKVWDKLKKQNKAKHNNQLVKLILNSKVVPHINNLVI